MGGQKGGLRFLPRQFPSSNAPLSLCLPLPSLDPLSQGMRGIQFEYLNYAFSGSGDLPRLGSTITVESTGGNRSTLQGTWETPLPLYSQSQYCTRSSAFFSPPVDGNYTFWLAGDDALQLRGTWTMVSGAVTMEGAS